MRHTTIVLLLGVLVAQIYAAPELISLKDGKLSVNFMGFHAAVGWAGNAGGNGVGGGLIAEAGTPFGQKARTGIQGAVDENGAFGGNMYASATAGGRLTARAALGGGNSPK